MTPKYPPHTDLTAGTRHWIQVIVHRHDGSTCWGDGGERTIAMRRSQPHVRYQGGLHVVRRGPNDDPVIEIERHLMSTVPPDQINPHDLRAEAHLPTLPPCCTPTDGATLAEQLYCAYNRGGDPATAGLNYLGLPCPLYAELPENVRAKWVAAGARAEAPEGP